MRNEQEQSVAKSEFPSLRWVFWLQIIVFSTIVKLFGLLGGFVAWVVWFFITLLFKQVQIMRVVVHFPKFMGTKKRVQIWVLTLILFAYPPAIFAINFNPASLKGMSQAYGFVLGQEYSLSRIEKEFPELTGGVELARAQFSSTFPDINNKLEKELIQALGESQFQEIAAKLRIRIEKSIAGQNFTNDIAINFLEQVKARSKGKIENPVLEYLLAVKYTSNPVGEFVDGFRQRYQMDGTGKSQGIKLALQLPLSWAAKEGERPHVVQKWQSENGTGMEMMSIEIHDAQGYNPTKKEMEEFVRSGEVKGVVPKGTIYIASGNFNLEMRTGYWIQATMQGDRAGFEYYQNYLMYQIFFRGKAIGLTCAAVGPESEKINVNAAFKKVRPLCQQVLNSLVLMQAY